MEGEQKKFQFRSVVMIIGFAVMLALLSYVLLEVFTPYNVSPNATSTATTSLPEMPLTKVASTTLATSSVSHVIGKSKCYVGGCSGEICSATPDMLSNCIYRPEFACYKNARCEMQQSGDCGWTQSDILRSCLSGYSASAAPGVY